MAAPNAKLLDRRDAHARDRAIMVSRHLQARGIAGPLVLAAMGKVPREAFVPEHLTEFAYEDSALPIEAGQTPRRRRSRPALKPIRTAPTRHIRSGSSNTQSHYSNVHSYPCRFVRI